MPGNEVLEEAGLLDLDGDVVDAASIVVGLLALDVDEGRKRSGAVGQEDVLVGRDEIEGRRQGEEEEARDEEADWREDAGHRLRIRRGGVTGCRMRLEEPAREAAVDGDHGSGDVRRLVRGEEADDFADLARPAEAPERNRLEVVGAGAIDVDLGEARCVDPARAIELTVTPSGPTSRASVFAQPITPGRTELESARLSIGSRTELDVMFTMRPCPLRRTAGGTGWSGGSPRAAGARRRSPRLVGRARVRARAAARRRC